MKWLQARWWRMLRKTACHRVHPDSDCRGPPKPSHPDQHTDTWIECCSPANKRRQFSTVVLLATSFALSWRRNSLNVAPFFRTKQLCVSGSRKDFFLDELFSFCDILSQKLWKAKTSDVRDDWGSWLRWTLNFIQLPSCLGRGRCQLRRSFCCTFLDRLRRKFNLPKILQWP